MSLILPHPVSDMATYALGTLICILLMKYLGIDKSQNTKAPLGQAIVFSIPALAIAINNFPWVAFCVEKPKIALEIPNTVVTAVLCLLVAVFEETMFRAFLSKEILKNTKGKKDYFQRVLLAGAIFGAYHLLNIFFGASIPYTLLQVTYTTLIGSMLSIVHDKSQRLWICILIHFLYNVGGDCVKLLGIKEQWILPEIILTASVSVLVLLFYVVCVLKDEKARQ